MRIALAALFICLSLTAPARAEGPASLYATGNFRAAAEAGDRQGDVAAISSLRERCWRWWSAIFAARRRALCWIARSTAPSKPS